MFRHSLESLKGEM